VHLRVADGVWAIGDITGKGAFTHMSMYQAAIAIRDILGEPGRGAEYQRGAQGDVHRSGGGSVGITEAQARDRGLNVRVGTAAIPTRPGVSSTRSATRA